MADRLSTADRILALGTTDSGVADATALLDRASAGAATELFREFWKYTPSADFVDGLQDAPVSRPDISGLDQSGVSVRTLAEWQASGTPLSTVQDGQSTQRFPLADLALMLTGDLIVIEVETSPAEPISIHYGEGLSTPVLVRIAAGVKASLIEQARTEGFLNHSLYVHLGADAVLEHAFAADATRHSHWAMTQVQQATRCLLYTSPSPRD